MKTCKGCEHLHSDKSRCWYDFRTIDEYNEYSERHITIFKLDTLEEARGAIGHCGPDRENYSPTRYSKFIQYLKSIFNR